MGSDIREIHRHNHSRLGLYKTDWYVDSWRVYTPFLFGCFRVVFRAYVLCIYLLSHSFCFPHSCCVILLCSLVSRHTWDPPQSFSLTHF